MADNDIFVRFGAEVSGFLDGVKKVNGSIDKVADRFSEVTTKAAELGTKIAQSLTQTPLFRELDELTGGLARNFLDLGEAAIKAFNAVKVGSAIAKAALISTGIGALVVILGTVAAQWDNIKTAVTGVDLATRTVTERLEKQAEAQQQSLALANASENILKLQGKSQLEINNLKLKELSALLEIKRAQLSNFEDSLTQATAQEKRIKEVVTTILNGVKFVATAIPRLLALAITEVGRNLARIPGLEEFGNNIALNAIKGIEFLESGFDRIAEKAAEVLTPDLTTDFKDAIADTELEVRKLENTIAGIQLENIPLEKLEKFGKDLPALDLTGLSAGFAEYSDQVAKASDTTVQFANTVSKENLRLAAIAANLGEGVLTTIRDNLAEGIGGLFETIGATIAQGGNLLQAAGSFILGALGSLASQLGDLFIQYAITAGVFGKALAGIASGNPATVTASAAVLLAAGIALKAIGGAISSVASGGGGGGAGGGGGGGAFGGGASNSGITNNIGGFNNQGAQGAQEVIFRISGTQLIGVLRNANNSNARLAGADTIG